MCDLHERDGRESQHPIGVCDFVDELVVAFTNGRIYAHDHPRVRTSIDSLVSSLADLMQGSEGESFQLGVSGDYLFHDHRPLLGASLSASRLIHPLAAIGAGGVELRRQAGRRDFEVLMDVLGQRDLESKNYQEANMSLQMEGCSAIELLPPYREIDGGSPTKEGDCAAGEKTWMMDVPVHLYQGLVELLQDTMVRACHGETLKMSEARGMVEGVLKRLKADAHAMMSMSRYERYDSFTFGHSIRVCFLAMNFARSLIYDEAMLLEIGLAALLHDIGKARVPFEILHSTGRLSDEERLEMNQHPLHGAELLLEIGGGDPLAVTTAFSHHRTLDHGGYPQLRHRVQQSAGTKIVKICDVYEALTAVRPYKPSLSPVHAYRIMLSMMNHFDLSLLHSFIAANGVFPVGHRVRLSNGEVGRVQSQGDDPLLPVVDVEVDGGGVKLRSGEQIRRHLDHQGEGEPIAVEELLVSKANEAA